MAQRVEIEVEITPAGEVRFTVKGMKGKGCLDLAKPLEEALGAVEERKLTDEYREAAAATQTRKTRKTR